MQISDDYWIIACGGDDNKITLNLVQNQCDGFYQIHFIEKVDAHSSQITGINFIMLKVNL